MTMPQGASGLNPEAWMAQWVLRANANPPAGWSVGASGASGASGGSPGSFSSGFYTDGVSSLNARGMDNIQAYYTDAMPLLVSWQNAAESLFNFLLSGFTSVGDIIETLLKVFLGIDVDLSFLEDEVREVFEAIGAAISPIVKFFVWVWDFIDENILKGIFEFLGWLWDQFGNAVEAVLKPIFEFLGWVWDQFGDTVETFMKPVIQFLNWCWDQFEGTVETIAKPIVAFLVWLFEGFGGVVESVLKPVAEFIVWGWGELGDVAEAIVGFLSWLWTNFGDAVDSFLKPVVTWVGDLWTSLGSVKFDNIASFFENITASFNGLNILEDAADFFKMVVDNYGTILEGIPTANDLLTLMSTFLGNVLVPSVTEGLQMLGTWLTQIPVIGSIIAAVIPADWTNNNGQGPTNLADLAEYAAGLLTSRSVLPAMNLQGQVPADLLPVVTPGMVGDKSINFVADSGFAAATQLQSGSGWGWDSGQSHSSDGGSARVYGDGGVKQLFSNLVAVSPGQEIYVEVYFKAVKPGGVTPNVSVGLRGYNGYDASTVAFTYSLGAQTLNSVATSVGWTKLSGSYKIPTTGAFDNVQYVRLALQVVNAPAGVTVWFDDAVMRKISLIGQSHIDGSEPGSNLADDLANTIGSYEWGQLVDRIAKKTGASLTDVQQTIDNFLTGNSNLNANKITSGNISSAFVQELKDTWNIIYQGAGNTSSLPPQAGVINYALGALQQSAEVAGGHGADIIKLNSEVNELKSKVAALITASNTTPPPIITAKDEFNRTSGLGGDWVTAFYGGGSFSTDGTSAVYNSGVNSNWFGSAVYNKAGTKTSASQYQKIYVSLTDKPGVPFLTGGPGFNDLVGRATSNTVCIVARFFANRTIKLFYRNGSWENDIYNPSTTFGTLTCPSEPTAGTTLEFFIGTKSVSDQTRCYVKIGSWESGAYFVSPGVLAGMGSGWGFGIGNGIGTPALGAKVNYWGASDQA